MKNAKTKQNKKVISPKKKVIVKAKEAVAETVEKPKKRGKGIVALKHKMVLDNMTKNISNSKQKNSLYQAMIDAGATRLGTSNGVDIMKGNVADGNGY